MSEIEQMVATLEEATRKYREAEESLNYTFSLLAQKVNDLTVGGCLPMTFYGIGELADALKRAYAKLPVSRPKVTVNLPGDITVTLRGDAGKRFMEEYDIPLDTEPGSHIDIAVVAPAG